VDDVLGQAGELSGKVIVSCSLPMHPRNTELVAAHMASGAEVLAMKTPKAAIVSAFGTVPSEVLLRVFESPHKAARPSLVYCGDDSASKAVAAELIRDAGFEPRWLAWLGAPVPEGRAKAVHGHVVPLHPPQHRRHAGIRHRLAA
jgi:hypothetical protein